MKKYSILFFALFACLMEHDMRAAQEEDIVSAGWAKPSPEIKVKRAYPCYKLNGRPVMDGIVKEDPQWQNIPSASGFAGFQKTKNIPAAKQTSFKIGYTDEALYIAVICEEPDIKLLAPAKREVWANDSIEIFLLPKNAYGWYRHLAANPWNKRFTETCGIAEKGSGADVHSWWHAKAYSGPDFWSVEIELPFGLFFEFPQKNDVWYGNICRSAWAGNKVAEYSSWAYLMKGFKEPNNFGKIVFMGENSKSDAGKSIVSEKVREYLKKYIVANLLLLKKAESEQDANSKEITAGNDEEKKFMKELDSASMADLLNFMQETDAGIKQLDAKKEEILKSELLKEGN